MRLWTWVMSCLLLSACSVTHQVIIPKPPCLYPFYDYDFSLCEAFNYEVNDNSYTVPLGFQTDLASIPRILWSIYSPNKANTIPAAIIHDYLYFCPGEMKRKEADSIFYDALIYKHVGKTTAFKYWLAVRIFGKSHFHEGAVCTSTLYHINNSLGHQRYKGIS